MKRLNNIIQSVISNFRVARHTVGLEITGSTLRVVNDGEIIAQEPAMVFEHKQFGAIKSLERQNKASNTQIDTQNFYQQNTFFHPNISAKPLISKGVITDTRSAKKIIQSLIDELMPPASIFNPYQGLCVVPTSLNALELQITQASLPSHSVKWSILPKALLHQLAVSRKFSESQILSVLDVGSEITEFTVSKKPLSKELFDSSNFVHSSRNLDGWLLKNTVSHTLHWGLRDLEQELQMLIRDIYQVQLSFDAFQLLFSQLGDGVFDVGNDSKRKFALRAQSLASGRPVTVTMYVADLKPAFLKWYQYLTAGLSVMMQKNQEDWFMNRLQQGLAVVGSGASISDLVPVTSSFFDVLTTTVPDPRSWTAYGLQIATSKNKL
jgi:actin-like ATPase involved in cell morphogenesis